MNISALLSDKGLKPKAKTTTLSNWLMDKTITPDELILLASTAKDSEKATCIEAIEFATKINPNIANEATFQFVSQCLAEKAPRIKWESAKVVGNTAHLFSTLLQQTIENLLKNTSFEGTVVRWSAAFALGEILKLKTQHNLELLPLVENICHKEEKNSIKKIYIDAIKKTTK